MGELLIVIVLGIVEGLTEFLPVSSTGHLLLCERWMGLNMDDGFWKAFAVIIQMGAIFAVVVYFRRRIIALLASLRSPTSRGRLSPVWLVALATVPVLVVGKLAHGWVEEHFESKANAPLAVSLALGIGGLIMIGVELMRKRIRTERMEEMTIGQAMTIGLCQCLAVLFPGTSRSAATIIPGLALGLSRETAAEFSFFLAIPAMFAAGGYSILKLLLGDSKKHIAPVHVTGQQWMLLSIGTLVSFIVAWAVIALFMGYVRRRTFLPFAVYRIILAGVVLWMLR